MKKYFSLVIFIIICKSALAQRNEVADSVKKNDQETRAVIVAPVSFGVKRGIGYKFLLRRGDEDPGNGMSRFNDDNVSDVRYIYVDNFDISGEDQTKLYSSWDFTEESTSRGRLTISDKNGKIVDIFYLKGAFIDGEGFWKLPVEYVSGELPLDGNVYYYVFDRIANKKETDNNNQNPPVNPVIPVITVEKDSVVIPVPPVEEVITFTPVEQVIPEIRDTVIIPVPPVEEVITFTPVEQIIPEKRDTVIIPVPQVEEVITLTPVEQVIPEKRDTVIIPVPQVEEVITVTQEVPVIPVKKDTIIIPFTPVAEVITVTQEVPVIPVKKDTVISQVNPVIPERPVSQSKPERPATPVNQPKPANPVSQPKPSVPEKPVIQDKPAAPVSQPKPSNQGNQTYPVNQGNQTYPRTENRLPVYQRNVGPSVSSRRKWYRGIIEAGYGLGIGDYGIDNFRINFINGFKFGNSSLGLGIGYRRYFNDNNSAPYLVSKKSEVPVFLDFRTTFTNRKLTPYFALGLGGVASADTTQSGQSGLFFTTSGGIWYNLSDRFAVFAGIAYELQKLEFSDNNPYTGNYRKNSNSISLNIGIAF